MEVQLTEPELALHERVRAVIQGNAKPGRHHKDAFHLVEKRQIRPGFHHQRRAALEKGLGDLAIATNQSAQAERVLGGVLCVCGTRPTMTEVVPSSTLGGAVVLLERTLRMVSPTGLQ